MLVEIIPIPLIKTDPQYQMRITVLDEDHVTNLERALSENSDLLERFPISLANVDDTLTVVDGFHRFEAAKRLKMPTVSAKIVAQSKREALEFAAGCNNHEGAPMKRTASDRRKALESLLSHDDFRKLTNTQLAEIVGCSMQTVSNIRNSDPKYACDIRVTRDGKELSSKVAGSGAAARGGRAILDDDQKAALATELVARGMGSNLEQSAPATEPIAKPKESDQAVILRLEDTLIQMKMDLRYYKTDFDKVWNLALERRPDLFRKDEDNEDRPEPSEILKRVLDSMPVPAAAPTMAITGAPSKDAAKWLTSCLKSKAFTDGKTISEVTANARKKLNDSDRLWLNTELKSVRDHQKAVQETVE